MLDLQSRQYEVRSQSMDYEDKNKHQTDDIIAPKTDVSDLAKEQQLSEPSGVERIDDNWSNAVIEVSKSSSTKLPIDDDNGKEVDVSTVSIVPNDVSIATQVAIDNRSNSAGPANDHEDAETDDFDEKDLLESFDRIIEEECKLINDSDILREEELVGFKERCIKLTDENISLRKEIDCLRNSGNKHLTTIIYTAPLAILLLYYMFSMIFS